MNDQAPDLHAFLVTHGASSEQIAEAQKQGVRALQMLAIDLLVLGAPKKYTSAETARMAGMPSLEAKRYWRALGFVDIPDDEVAFTDADVAALTFARIAIESSVTDATGPLQVTRVVGQSAARIADALTALTASRAERLNQEEGLDRDWLEGRLLQESERLIPMSEAFLGYAFRRHLAATAKRRVAADPDASSRKLAVGFCDLVGFTSLARRVEESELVDILERFETTTYDVIASLGGRLVKMIGDEVMFVAPDPSSGAQIALQLSEEHTRDPKIPDCRIGLAYGAVMPREGDYFGETVNLASRIQTVAYPKTVLVSADVATALDGKPDFRVRPIRPRYLKGVGRTKLWALGRRDSAPHS